MSHPHSSALEVHAPGNGSADAGFEVDSDLQYRLREGEERVREFIRRHPVPVVLGALALGFVVARAFRES